MTLEPAAPSLELLARVRADVDDPYEIGPGVAGERRVVRILGGEVSGSRLRGRVLPGGADFQLVGADGTALLEARYVVETDDGALVYVRNVAIRSGPPEVLARLRSGEEVDASEYYFRSTPRFECGDPRYAWLNRVVAVASGVRLARSVLLDVYAVR